MTYSGTSVKSAPGLGLRVPVLYTALPYVGSSCRRASASLGLTDESGLQDLVLTTREQHGAAGGKLPRPYVT